MRKRRELIDGFSYHVTARINRQEFLFDSDEIKEMFMDVLRRAERKYHFDIRNFCIMNNHIHFILKPLQGESLSKIMQWILGVFAQKYNKIFSLKGHVWYDRFKSKLIMGFRQYLNTFIYISNNPVNAGIVETAVEYKYNGITSIQKGSLDIIERPPNKILCKIWNILNEKTNT
ncbi:MAG: transposase [Spirochaetia bacterium]|jgi:putative transposase|nr:transposase [Spirochaetia bacterium]